ncbi:hypothetical protein OC846_002208 [Tilletia horrida]|uniref:WLM domain-containing protein n=1 Tax=Tilletia horrida TaxID=155126 RepID=A0AAN6GSC6_9BASI|nr:hypothetical protein OC846_002208 [Tilletia horrida]KAK0564030.1 hypothetical protein OC861_004518 [Tilletia horrida]
MPIEGHGGYKKPAEQHRYVESIAASGPGTTGGSGPYIAEYQALKRKGSERCLEILRRIGTLVKPLMVRHGWKLPVLAEFFPHNQRLLGININSGQKICLRLRSPHNPEQIWDEHEVMGTMLHELTHNVRGPHDKIFYDFLDKLKSEYDTIRRSGWSGEGFLVPGRTLGRGMGQHVPRGMHTAVAAAMAEERRRRALLGLDSGPQRLGGNAGGRSLANGKSIQQNAAEAAAARRAQQDNAHCPNASATGSAQVEKEIADQERDEGVEILGVRPGGQEEAEDRAAADFVVQKVIWNADADAPSSAVKQEESSSFVIDEAPSVQAGPSSSKSTPPAPAAGLKDEPISVPDDSDSDEDFKVVSANIKTKSQTKAKTKPQTNQSSPLKRTSEGAPSMKLLKPAMWKRVNPDDTGNSAHKRQADQNSQGSKRSQISTDQASRSGSNVRSAEAAAGLALGLQAGWIDPHDLSQAPASQAHANDLLSHSSRAPSTYDTTGHAPSSGGWTCQTCTLLNNSSAETCAACSSPHPDILTQIYEPSSPSSWRLPEDGWRCPSCAYQMSGEQAVWWSCVRCGAIKAGSSVAESGGVVGGGVLGGGGILR